MLKWASLDKFEKNEEATYKELTMEFLYTLTEKKEVFSIHSFGRKRGMSLDDLNKFLGVPKDTLLTDEYQKAHRRILDAIGKELFWEELTGRINDKEKCSSYFQEYKYKIVHKFLASTLFGRYNQPIVSEDDLFILYWMERGEKD